MEGEEEAVRGRLNREDVQDIDSFSAAKAKTSLLQLSLSVRMWMRDRVVCPNLGHPALTS